jgi:hypothetical protein
MIIYIKNILFAIIVALIIYLGYEVMQTRSAVVLANNPYTKEEIRFTKYGPTKSDLRKKENLNIIATLSGTIDKNISYYVEVLYRATLDKPSCKEKSFWNGIGFKREYFIYKPKIDGTKHTITIPLKEINPKKGCQYKVNFARIFFHKRGDKRKGASYVLFTNNKEEALTNGYRAGNFDFLDKYSVVNVECLNPSISANSYYYPCGSKPLKNNFAIVKRIPPQSVNAIYNISELSLDSVDSDTLNSIMYGKSWKKRMR